MKQGNFLECFKIILFPFFFFIFEAKTVLSRVSFSSQKGELVLLKILFIKFSFFIILIFQYSNNNKLFCKISIVKINANVIIH